MKITVTSENVGPFRLDWLEALADYADIEMLHTNNYAGFLDEKYINSVKPNKVVCRDISRTFFKKIKLFKARQVFNSKFDILICDGYGFLAQQIMILMLQRKKIPYVLSVDGGFVKLHEHFVKKAFKKLLISKANAYFSTSAMADDMLVSYGAKREKIYRHYCSSVRLAEIANCVPDDNLKNDLRKKLSLGSEPVVIGVGHLIPRKGFDILIQSLRYLKNKVTVVIVGSGDRNQYEKLLDDNIHGTVVFTGFVEREKLREYYQASDVFVLPTREDVWGLVIGEAMANGLPVITTDQCVAGVEMIIDGQNGYIIPANDPIACATAIDKTLEDGERKIIMSNNNLTLIRKYSVEEAARMDFQNLERICRGVANADKPS
jgi:glycosyltransferase involved in cell wall biosynthesis